MIAARLEAALARLWSRTLRVNDVGRDDDFLLLGGDRAGWAALIASINSLFRVDLRIESLPQDAMTVAGMARVIVAVRSDAGADKQSASRPTVISRRQEGEAPRLSAMQRRMWFLARLFPDDPTYNQSRAYRLVGEVDVDMLDQSARYIARRHEILRTSYSLVNDEPKPIINEDVAVEIKRADLREVPSTQQNEALQTLLLSEMQKPFDLDSGPPWRILLVHLSRREHVLLRVAHHIVSDGWSSSVFERELSTVYNAFVRGLEPRLPVLPIQYADFAAWQCDSLQGKSFESQLNYWRTQLAGLSKLDLPTDRPRPPVASYRGTSLTVDLPAPLVAALRGIGRQDGTTLFMKLVAIFQVLLYRYSGQEDIAVGTPIAGRKHTELEGLLGFFTNTLVLRTDLSGNPAFRELLARVRRTALDAYTHQELPFEMLVQELAPERDMGRNPLFQVMFVLQNVPDAALEMEGLKASSLPLQSHSAKFDLVLTVRESAQGFHADWESANDLFDAVTIKRMAQHFRRLLEGVVTDPDRRISDLPVLTETEEHQLLVGWNEPKRDYPKDKCLHQLFEEQVERTPDAIALVFDDQHLTYRELNSRANQLAHYLRKLGVGSEVLVGLCLERSIDMIVGLLGVLKAGGAYVPLDPESPDERLAFMLEDTQAQVLVTQACCIEDRRSRIESRDSLLSILDPRLKVIYLDGDWPQIGRESPENVRSKATAENLAYVIYTSGSTGKPKGVLVTHHNVARLFGSTQTWFHFDHNDVWTLFHSYAFDFSVWEIWGALLNGGKAAIVPRETTRSPQEFAALLAKHKVTVLNQTPSAFRQLMPCLISTLAPEQSALRYVIFGGEALELQCLQPWFDRFGDGPAQLVNMYGITETTVHVTHRPITQADIQSKTGSVIGRPLPDLQVYVLDHHQHLQPIGVPGEMYVGGAGVAKGYLQRPELTSERFIRDLFSSDPQARLYRSGDLARWLPNGELEYRGRIDDQVKIRGHRIELGEIEAVLGQYPGIREAAVLAREDSPGDKRLVAYIVAISDSIPSTNELRTFLKEKLPEYMVPSMWMFLESLPLTTNGKLNRQALPIPEQSRPELDESFSVPRTPIEELLANIWAKVLRLARVGIDDNFFELGGHSLLATQVVARIREALDVELPLRRFFRAPTIRGLATIIAAERQTAQAHQLPPIRPASREGGLPLSFAQQRLWFINQLEPESSVYNVPGAWRLSGSLEFPALQRSINEIVRRHESLRTNFVVVDGQPVQRIRPFAMLPMERMDLADTRDSEKESAIELHVREEIRKPFDLARGPLLRAKLLQLGEDDHVLLLTMHHIVTDGWSIGVLFRELSRLYEAFAGGNVSALEELPIQYADYAVWQRGWLQGEILEAQLNYWRKQLEDLAILQLPTDRQRPAVQRYRGAKTRINLDAALTKKLGALSRGENATLYITLLAAFQVLLSRYSAQEDIAVGSPIAGRYTPELEGLIGLFVNTLVLRADLSNNPSFREFLRRMRDVALEAYAHQDLAFEKLVEDLRPQRNLNISPLFQVMFVLQNDPREEFELKGLSIRSVFVNSETAKFDLLLSLRESERGLAGTLEYDTDLFDSATIERMAGQFEILLNGIVANPNQRLLQLPLLTEGERHQLLAKWNDTKEQYPEHLCVHQLFERQAHASPDRIAVVFEDRQISYKDVDLRSNQLARYLREKGVESESSVGVCLERSPEMIVALLAVLKAGAAYVPLDPSYPPERLRLMLEQAGTSSVLTQGSLVSRIPVTAACHCLDSLEPLLAQENQESANFASSPISAAYVLFTSGSTGVPKGVLMEHRPLVNLLSWQAGAFTSPVDARTLQFAPLSFDVSFQEIFSTLCSGGTLVMIDEHERRDTKALLRVVKKRAIERIFLPFVALEQLAEAAQNDGAAVESLREVITAGEQLQATRPIMELFSRLPNCRLHNQYGPTESHVVTTFPLANRPADWANLPPIGRPIANAEIYILDSHLNPVPIGVAGEIHIGGSSPARGYVSQPELTAEKFITHSFDGESAKRLYKTGDVARYSPDGNIEFLGRNDDQVKIRGYRIELGEIECTLVQHSAVQQAVVRARGENAGDKRLVAYMVPREPAPTTSDLRAHLKATLPDYMVPSAFVFLDVLPLTSSGKVDYRALLSMDHDVADPKQVYVAPGNAIEQAIAEIWVEILAAKRIGVHDNFFELGGHSLLATQVVNLLRRRLKVELPLRRMFEAPTIAQLAEDVARLSEREGQVKNISRFPRRGHRRHER